MPEDMDDAVFWDILMQPLVQASGVDKTVDKYVPVDMNKQV